MVRHDAHTKAARAAAKKERPTDAEYVLAIHDMLYPNGYREDGEQPKEQPHGEPIDELDEAKRCYWKSVEIEEAMANHAQAAFRCCVDQTAKARETVDAAAEAVRDAAEYCDQTNRAVRIQSAVVAAVTLCALVSLAINTSILLG